MQNHDIALAVLTAIGVGFTAYAFYQAQKAKAADRRIEHYEAMLASRKRDSVASTAVE